MIADRTNVGARISSESESSSTTLWAGRILAGLLAAVVLFDALGKVFKADQSVEGTVELGYSEGVIVWIGLVLLASTVLYVIPRTAFYGAILLTGYLGGAIATSVRVEDAWFIMPAVMAVLIWVALAMRDDRLREFATQ